MWCKKCRSGVKYRESVRLNDLKEVELVKELFKQFCVDSLPPVKLYVDSLVHSSFYPKDHQFDYYSFQSYQQSPGRVMEI